MYYVGVHISASQTADMVELLHVAAGSVTRGGNAASSQIILGNIGGKGSLSWFQ